VNNTLTTFKRSEDSKFKREMGHDKTWGTYKDQTEQYLRDGVFD
jgi:hypothetical protein